jgi:hypothetical protein
VTSVIVCLVAPLAAALHQKTQQPSPAARALREVFDFVLGSWELEPEGAGGIRGRFSFEMDLGGRAVLHRIQVMGAPTPGADNRANELLIVVFAESGQLRALYLDNDGKVVRFDVGYAHDTGTLTFASEMTPGEARQRFTYRPLGVDRLEVVSEASNADGRGPLIVTSKSTWRRSPSVISCQLSVIGYQLSVISYRLSAGSRLQS